MALDNPWRQPAPETPEGAAPATGLDNPYRRLSAPAPATASEPSIKRTLTPESGGFLSDPIGDGGKSHYANEGTLKERLLRGGAPGALASYVADVPVLGRAASMVADASNTALAQTAGVTAGVLRAANDLNDYTVPGQLVKRATEAVAPGAREQAEAKLGEVHKTAGDVVSGIQGTYTDNSIGHHAMGVAASVPQMAAAVGTSIIGSPLAGAAVMGATTGADTYAGNLDEGYGKGEAAASGLAQGILEGGMDYVTLGMAKYGVKPVLDKLASKLGSETANRIVQKLTGNAAARIGTAAAEEALTEVATTAGQMGADMAILDKQYSADDWWKGLRDSAIQGGAMGGGVYAAGHFASPERGFQRRLPGGAPVPDPNAGPLSRAVNAGMDNGAIGQPLALPAPDGFTVGADGAVTRGLERPQVFAEPEMSFPQGRGMSAQFVPGQQPAARGSNGKPVIEGTATREAPAPQAFTMPGVTPPWISPDTGELLREPTANDIKGLLHQSLEFQRDNAGGISGPRTKRMMKEQFGLSEAQVLPLLKEVNAERRSGITAQAYQQTTPGIEPPANMDELDAQAHEWENQQFDNASDDDIVNMTRSFFGKSLNQVTPERAAEMTHRAPEVMQRLWGRITGADEQSSTGKAMTYDESPDLLDTDITPPSGGVFENEGAAAVQARRVEGGRVVPVDGGFVVRTPRVEEAAQPAQQPPAADEAAPLPAAVAGVQGLGASPQDTPVTTTPEWNTRKVLEGMPVGHQSSVNDVMWTQSEKGRWTDGQRTVSTGDLSRMFDRFDEPIDSTAAPTRAALPAPTTETPPQGGVSASGPAEFTNRNKSGPVPFKTAAAAQKVVRNAGQQLADYDIVERDGGFVAVRKIAADAKQPGENLQDGSAKEAQSAGVQHLAKDESQVSSSDQSGFSVLRGKGSEGVPSVDAQLRNVPAGHGAETSGQVLDRQNRPKRGLRAGELPLGDGSAAGQQPTVLPQGGARGDGIDDSGSGARGANFSDDASESGSAPASPAGTGTPPRATAVSQGLEVPNAQREDAKRSGVGEGTGDQGANVKGAATPGDATRKGVGGRDPTGLEAAAHEAATSSRNDLSPPSEAQIEANNYKHGHIRFNGYDISIENPAGSKRSPEWPALKNHYGYFKGTIGKDKDHVDVFMTDDAQDPSLPVFIVDQVNKDGSFDEHKVIMGAADEAEARKVYLQNYEKGWTGLGAITQMSQDEFKAWLADPKKTKRPAGKLATQGKENAGTLPKGEGKESQGTNEPMTPSVKGSKTGITDSGEQLRNNNRNRYGGVRWQDVEGLNDTARIKAVTREAVWPDQKWEALVKEEGLVPYRVLAAKLMRSVIPKAPVTRGVPTDADLRAYIEAVTKVRDVMDAYMRDPDTGMAPGQLKDAVFQALMPNKLAAGRFVAWEKFPEELHALRLLGSNKFLNALQRRRLDQDALRSVLNDGWPDNKQEAWERRFKIRHSDAIPGRRISRPGDGVYGYYITRKQSYSIMAGPFVTEDEAINAAREMAKPKRTGPEEKGLALKDVQRIGAPRRDADATPDQLRETFGFRGVNFGNWVNQKERQAHLNHAYDAFSDLADLLGIPPRAISLNGMLGIAFGAQGKGKAAAHFVPGDNEINITKTAGAGALAHEWGHALDHYFAVMDGPKSARAKEPFLTNLLEKADQGGTRREVVAAFREVVDAMQRRELTPEELAAEKLTWKLREMQRTEYARASGALDAKRSKPYWSTPWEMFARALELYSLQRLADAGSRNDYLTSPGKLKREAYPQGEDAVRINNAFDKLFKLLETRETERGTALFSATAHVAGRRPGLGEQEVRRIAERILGVAGNADQGVVPLVVVGTTKELPQPVQNDMKAGGVSPDEVRGVHWGGKSYLVAANLPDRKAVEEVTFHEHYAHGGLRAKYGKQLVDVLNRLAKNVGGLEGIRKLAREQGIDLSKYEDIAFGKKAVPEQFRLPYMMEELLAHASQTTGTLRRIIEEFVGAVRAWLRDSGFAALADYGVTDLAHVLKQAREAAQAKTTRAAPRYSTAPSNFSLADTFRSALVDSVEAGKGAPKRATAEQWKGWLDGAQRRGEFRQTERDWMGVDIGSMRGATISNGPSGYRVNFPDGRTQPVGSFEEGMAAARGAAVHSIDITPDMRAAALGGLPLFSAGGRARGGLDIGRAQELKRDLTAKWGPDAPSVILVEDASGFPETAKVDPNHVRAEGFYDGKPVVWLNLGMIRDEKRFAEVLAHEALGHYGVESIVGEKEWDGIVDAVDRLRKNGSTNPKFAAVLADVQRRYGQVDRVTFAKETIAVMAERGMRNSWVNKVLAAVQRWVRKYMPGMKWNERDLLGLLGQAESFLHRGPNAAARAELVQSYAFSRGVRSAFDDAAEFASKVRRFIAGNLTGSGDVQVTQGTPDVYVKLGVPDKPFVIRRDKLAAIRNDHPEITDQVLMQLVRNLHEPVAVFQSGSESTNQHGLVALTEMESDGKPIIIALHLGVARRDGVIVNRVASYYGKDSREKFLNSVGALRYIDQSKTPAWLPEQALLPKGSRAKAEVSGGTVLTDHDVVKPFSSGTGTYSLGDTPKVQVDGRGQRSIEMGGETFVDRSGRFYMVNGTGEPKDFRTLGAATEAAQRTGGEVLHDDAIEGERPSWSVVVPDVAAREAAQRGPSLFSLAPADVLDDLDAVNAAAVAPAGLERAKQVLKDITPSKVKDALRGTWLGALTTRHLTELGQDYFKGIRHYSDFLSGMQADRNKLQAEAEGIAEPARKWASKNRPMAERLFGLMHRATMEGVDPSAAYQPLQFQTSSGWHDVTPKNVRDAIKTIRQIMRERSGDPKKNMLDEVKALNSMRKAEPRRRAAYAPLVAEWNQLSPEAQALYVQMRDVYKERSSATEEALVQRIEDMKGDGVADSNIRSLVQRIRQQFESNRLQGVYFPLQRFGQYFIAATKGDNSTFLMYPSLNQMERATRDLKQRGWAITAQGLKAQGKAKDAPSGTFVAEVIQELEKAKVSDKTQDAIYQLYLEALPELSMRKHQIHRKAIPGFDKDALRAFAYNMHHGSHQLARLRYGHKLQAVLDVLQQGQDAARKEPDADTRRIAAGDTIIGELNRRHEWIMSPTDSQLTNLVSSAGFVYYLGLTPAAALVNLTQTAMISYPYLASRYGGIKAMNYLLSASKDAIRTVGNIQRTLTDPDELRAHAALQASGALDKTQAQNLAGIAEGGMQGYNPAWNKAMEIIGWGFHKTEVVNREATGLAAFRLARAEGKNFDEAVRFAHDVIFDTHFDYSNANRARFMQSGTAKVLLMFRQYSLNMTWHLGRMVWQATKGESPEVKRIARRNLAGVLGMSALFSGTMGLPMMGVVTGVLDSIAASFGDDDEPWDAETEFRAFLSDMIGAEAAEIVLGGVANQVTGADIAGRVSLSQLWFRDADRELDGRGAYYNLLEQAAGPMGGVLKNALVGKQMMDEGHFMRGVETVLPKSLKDMLKAARYATQGVNNLRGDPVVKDLPLYGTLLQLAGFSPAKVAERYELNRSLKNYEQHILDRRQHLMNAYALAHRLGDQEAQRDVLAQIRRFNQTNREVALTPKSIRQSLAVRARYSQRAESGIVLNPKLAARLKAEVGG